MLGCLFLIPSKVCAQSVLASSSSISKTLSFSFPLSSREAVTLSTEYLYVSSLPSAFASTFTKQLGGKPTWRMKAVPVTVSYSYKLARPKKGITPVFGLGLSYYFSDTKQINASGEDVGLLYGREDLDHLNVNSSWGMGYGAEATLGLHIDVTRHMFAQVQGRARYVNSLGFIGKRGADPRCEFTKLDFAIGFGVKL